MRIKSYFAASVQAAIGMARQEFGDGVTLVTSHVAGPDARHLGQYEVVFAVEDLPVQVSEPEATEIASSAPAAFNEFQQLLLAAVQPKAPVAAEEKLDRVRETLIDLGLDPATTSAIMTLIEKALPVSTPSGATCYAAVKAPDEPAPAVSVASGRHPQLSAAELSFISAVSGSPGAATVSDR